MDTHDRTHEGTCEHLTVEGILHGRRVTATWAPHGVVGDPSLLAVAEAVIATGATHDHDPSVVATWDDLPGATVALVRAVEQLIAADVTVGPATPVPDVDAPGDAVARHGDLRPH
jgi:hypothetical protein